MTGKSATACGYPASLAVAMLSAIKRQMISDGAIRVGELHFLMEQSFSASSCSFALRVRLRST